MYCNLRGWHAEIPAVRVLLLAGGAAWAAQVVGVVAHLSGPLLDRKADGSVKVLAAKSEVENGDTLVSEKNTYAQIRFVDNSEITLKPGTTFRIENFSYEAGKPDADSAAFSLVKGGLRSITGLLGKRNKEKFSLKTPAATIGIRGTTFIAQSRRRRMRGPTAIRSRRSTTRKRRPTPGKRQPDRHGPVSCPPTPGARPARGRAGRDDRRPNAAARSTSAAGQFGFVPSRTRRPSSCRTIRACSSRRRGCSSALSAGRWRRRGRSA
jgi:hypothetical protein